jgi:hypothetical protein
MEIKMRLFVFAICSAALSTAQVNTIGKDIVDAYEKGVRLRQEDQRLELEKQRLEMERAQRSKSPQDLEAVKRRALAQDANANFSQRPTITIETVMTQADQADTGIVTLNALQRSKLDKWLSEFTLKVIQYVQASETKPFSAVGSKPGNYSGSSRGHWIKSKTDGGEIITLENGSMCRLTQLTGSIPCCGYRLLTL